MRERLLPNTALYVNMNRDTSSAWNRRLMQTCVKAAET